MLASMVQGMTGFGFALLAVPLLSLFFPLKEIVPVIPGQGMIIGLVMTIFIFRDLRLRKMLPMFIAGGITTPFGAFILLAVSPGILKTIIGALVLFSAIAMGSGLKIKIRNERLSYIFVGFLSGILNGSVSLAGPPAIVFLSNQGASKEEFRANLTVYFLLLSFITFPAYFASGLITPQVLMDDLIYAPATLFGVLIGIFYAKNISEEFFKKVTLILIIIMGILSLSSGAGSLWNMK